MTTRASTPERVELRPVLPDDLPVLHSFEADPVGNALAGVKPRDKAAFIAHWQRILAMDTVCPRTILADGVVAGSISCFEVEDRAELGYWIGRAHWGLGVATRAVGLLLLIEPRRPLHAHVSAANPASIRVLERHGFVRTAETEEPETDRYRAGPVIAFRLD